MNHILARYQNPISTTSINPSGQEPASNLDEILNYFESEIDLILSDNKEHKRAASTIVKVDKNDYSIIRQGDISSKEIDQKL